MIILKLTSLIEAHADKLAQGLTRKILASEKMADMRKVPAQELHDSVREIYANLHDGLLTQTEPDLEHMFITLGSKWKSRGVAPSHFLLAILSVKEHLLDFLQHEVLPDDMLTMRQELELIFLLDRFFDRALYFGARGYERVSTVKAA